MGCFRMRNSGLGEMFRGFVSCDMMYREGLVSSYLVSISLPSPNISDMRTPDTESWVAPSMCSLSLLNARYHHHLKTRVALTRVKTHAASVWINPQESDICGAEQRKLKEVKLQVFTKICLDTNTYYVKLRVCWSRKVIILSNVNIYGRQHISNSSWWAVNFDPRLEEILQASVPCLLERESHPSYLLIHFMRGGKCQVPGGEWCPGWLGCSDDDHGDRGVILCQCGVNNRVTRCHLSYGVTQS